MIAGYAPVVEQIKLCFRHEMLREQIRQSALHTFKKLVDEIKSPVDYF